MDVVGSILSSEKLSSSKKNSKEFASGLKEEQSSIKCNVCGKFFTRSIYLTHYVSHYQENKNGKIPSIGSKNVSNTDQKVPYKCLLCGKVYNERKAFISHKNNHKRNQKLKDAGIHPFDKEGSSKLKSSTTNSQTVVNSANHDNQSVNTNILKFREVPDVSVKSMINPDVTANPMSCAADWAPPDPVDFYVPLLPSASDCLPQEPVGSNVSVFPSVSDWAPQEPVGSNVSASFSPSVADWAPPEPVGSNVPASSFPPNELVSEESSQTKKMPPSKKASYKCNLCGKVYTARRAFINHKTNHVQNKKKQKLLLYERHHQKMKKVAKQKN